MKRLIKFGFVGIMNTIITMISYNSLVYFGINYLIANIIGYALGTINSYVWNNNWVFKTKSKKVSIFIKFITVNIISLGLNTGILYVLVTKLNFNKSVAQICAIVGGMGVNYILNRVWTFNEGEDK